MAMEDRGYFATTSSRSTTKNISSTKAALNNLHFHDKVTPTVGIKRRLPFTHSLKDNKITTIGLHHEKKKGLSDFSCANSPHGTFDFNHSTLVNAYCVCTVSRTDPSYIYVIYIVFTRPTSGAAAAAAVPGHKYDFSATAICLPVCCVDVRALEPRSDVSSRTAHHETSTGYIYI